MTKNVTLGEVISRRLLVGEVATLNENGKIFVAFDRVTAHVIDDRMVLELRYKDFIVSSHECRYYPGSQVHLTGVGGHVELSVNV